MPIAKKRIHRKRVLAHRAHPKRSNGSSLCCDVCGREVTISDWGTSESTMYCCAKPMKHSR